MPSSTERDLRIGVVGIPGAWSSESLADAFAERTGERLLIDMAHIRVDVGNGSAKMGDHDIGALDALVVKKLGAEYGPDLLDRIEMLRCLEERGVRVFSNPDRIGRLIYRLAGSVVLASAGVPMPRTVATESIDEAVRAITDFEEAILKPHYSTKARGMRLVRSEDEAELRRELAEFQSEGNPVIYIQKRIDLPERDLGIVYLGDEYLGTYARVKTNDSWDTTTRSGGKYAAVEPSQDVLEVADRARKAAGLDFTVVDVAETDDGPLVFEVSAFGGFRGCRDALDLDVPPRFADYVIKALQK